MVCAHVIVHVTSWTETKSTSLARKFYIQGLPNRIWIWNFLERLRIYWSVCEFTGASESQPGFLKFWWSIWDFWERLWNVRYQKNASRKKRSLKYAPMGSGCRAQRPEATPASSPAISLETYTCTLPATSLATTPVVPPKGPLHNPLATRHGTPTFTAP